MILTLNINSVNFILVEMSVVLLRQFDILAIFAQVNLHGVVSYLIEELLYDLSLLVGHGADVLVGLGVGQTLVASEVILGDWVEAVEKRFEEGVFGLLDDTENSGALWLVVSFDETFTDG